MLKAKTPGVNFTHARRLVKYNLPLYASAGGGILAGALLLLSPRTPRPLRWLAGAGMTTAGWYSAASFGAFHWMFDRSGLLEGRWIAEEVPMPPEDWVQISTGLEQTTVPLAEIFPESRGQFLDIYDPVAMNEPALTRARQELTNSPAQGSAGARPAALPVADSSCDLVLVMLAAHEIRDVGIRENFFRELRRIVTPGGNVLLVEHLRDLAAALAFGPGLFHFLPRREWLRLGALAGLELQRERSITPFVRVFVFESQKY